MATHPALAALPLHGGYFSIGRWIVLLIAAVIWLGICQWVDKDSARLRFRRFTFNGLLVGAGGVAMLLWMLLPSFLAGLLVYLLFVGASTAVYVVLRNRLVPDASKVLTAEHFHRLISRQMPERKAPPPTIELRSSGGAAAEPVGEEDPLYPGYVAGQTLLGEAVARRVEQFAVVPSEKGMQTVFVIDGVRTNEQPIDRRTGDLLVTYFKKLAGMDLADRRRPQTGSIEARPPDRRLVIEIKTSGSRAGEAMQMSIVEPDRKLGLGDLGLSDRQVELVSRFRNDADRGVVLIGAGHGLGSTTTFYRMLAAHDTFTSNVQTLEQDPSDDLDNITQHRYDGQSAGDASFARTLQSILRRGPDVVGVSLCRDKETAQLISRTAAERTRFYVEMPGRDTFTLLDRWAALVEDRPAAVGPLALVFAQTLVRKLCPQCKEAYRPDPQLLRKLNLSADRIEKLYRPPAQRPVDKDGNVFVCESCQNTGYLGRTGVFEMLVVDDQLRKLVAANTSGNEIKKYCRSQKMLYLQEEALRKVIAGETSIQEVLRVLREKGE